MNRSLATYLASLLILSSNGIIAADMLLSSTDIVFYRALIGSMALIAVFVALKQHWTWRENRHDTILAILAGIATAGNWLFVFTAYRLMGVSLTIVINYSGPAIAILLAPLFLKERITIVKLIMLVCVMAGVCAISGQAATTGITMEGILCASLAALCFAFMIILNKKIIAMPDLERVIIQIMMAGVVLFGAALWEHGMAFYITQSDMPAMICLALINTGLAYYLYYSPMPNLSLQTVSVCGYLEPVSALFLSAVILGEMLTPLQWVGAILIIGSAVWSEIKQHKSP